MIDGATVTAGVVLSPDADGGDAVTGSAHYRAEVGGAWRRVAEQPSNTSVVTTPDEPDNLLRSGHPPCVLGGPSIPLEISDSGLTWQRLPGIPAIPVRDLAVGCSGDVLYATTDDGVRRLTHP